jgi:hypothetical protein
MFILFLENQVFGTENRQITRFVRVKKTYFSIKRREELVSKLYGFETPCSRLIHKRIQGGTIFNFIDTAPCKHNKSSED